MSKSKITLKLGLIVCCLVSFCACQTIGKLYFGYKTPEAFVAADELIEFYKPYYNDRVSVKLYNFKDTTALHRGYNIIRGFPLIYVANIENKKVYQLEMCFDDMEWQVEQINAGDLAHSYLTYISMDSLKLKKARMSQRLHKPELMPAFSFTDSLYIEYLNLVDLFQTDQTKLIFENTREVKSPQGKWASFVVYSYFMGSKVQKYVLELLKVKGLRYITILDMSTLPKS